MLATPFSLLVVAAGLFLPGWAWARAYRWPVPAFAAGVVSALAVFAGVLGGALLGIPVTAASLGVWLAGVALAGFAIGWRKKKGGLAREAVSPPSSLGEWWLALPALPMLAVAAWHAIAHPLWSADTGFRWNHLAHLIVQTGHLDYYPAHTPAGFTQYFWADGIAPLVSSLFAWSYLAAGSEAGIWTAVTGMMQVTGLVALLYALGKFWGGTRGGWFAVALGGGTFLLQFAFAVGQETGCTTLGVGGMALYLLHWNRTPERRLLVPAAACAALAACAREYGIAFVFLGTAMVWQRSRRFSDALLFAGIAGALPFAWHMRNWILTGNPLYAHRLAGLFPTNVVFDAWMDTCRATFGQTLVQIAGWRYIGRLLLVGAVPAIAGFVAGAWIWRREAASKAWFLLGLAAALLWMWSVPLTSGGTFYSMRVLGPLLALGSAWGGAALARAVPGNRHLAGVMLGLTLFAGDASLRAWTVPDNPYATPPSSWASASYRAHLAFEKVDLGFLRAVAQRVTGKVLSDSPGAQPVFQKAGRELAPFWSPDVAFLFSAQGPAAPAIELRRLGYTHVLLLRDPMTIDFLNRHNVLTTLGPVLRPVLANDNFVLWEIVAEATQPAPAVPSTP